jgi:hypothetical protein
MEKPKKQILDEREQIHSICGNGSRQKENIEATKHHGASVRNGGSVASLQRMP